MYNTSYLEVHNMKPGNVIQQRFDLLDLLVLTTVAVEIESEI